METNRRTTTILAAIIAVLAIAAGALWYANSGLKTELAQLRDAQRALGTERDALKTEAQSQRERGGVLDAQLKTLQLSHDEQVAEAQRQSASIAESRRALDGAQAELKRLQQAQQEGMQQRASLIAERTTISQKLAEVWDQVKVAAAAIDNLSRELASAKKTLDDTRARAAEQATAFEQLLKKHSQLEATAAAGQEELKQMQQIQQVGEQKLQAVNAEKEALAQKLAGVQDQAKAAAAASDNLSRDLASVRKSLDDTRARAAEQTTAFEQLQKRHAQLEATAAARQEELTTAFGQLQKKHSQLAATDAAKQAELKQMQQAQQVAQQKLQALNAEKETLSQKLASVQNQAKAAAAAGDTLAHELGLAQKTLDDTRARAAGQTAAFEQLQNQHSQLAATAAAGQAELQQIQQAQQVAQQKLLALNAEKETLTQNLAGVQDQAKAAAAAGDTLARDLAAARKTLDEARARFEELNKSYATLRQDNSQLKASDAARQAELKQMQQFSQDAQQALKALDAEKATLSQAVQALDAEKATLSRKVQVLDAENATLSRNVQVLNADKETLSRKLAGVEEQARAAAVAGAKLSRELGSAQQTLDEARARSAGLNKAYEILLKDKSQLAASNAARQAELARAKIAFEEAQTEVARLTGARGIYTVQSADSLSSIAAYFYRNGNRWTDIHKANAYLSDNPDLIYAGQVLIIPQ